MITSDPNMKYAINILVATVSADTVIIELTQVV